MNQAYFEKWTEIAKKAQEPFQAISELNLKTLQEFSYLKPEELTHFKKPEEFLERQISLTLENSCKTLDYMQKSFQILGNAMLSTVQDLKNKSDITINKPEVVNTSKTDTKK